MREIADRAAQGRACGNLGNTHYLLGSFTQAIKYHQEVSHFLLYKFDLGVRLRRWKQPSMGLSQTKIYSPNVSFHPFARYLVCRYSD